MCVYLLKLPAESKKFIAFLETDVFHQPIESARQFAHGSASENFVITVNHKRYIVKLIHREQKSEIERLVRIYDSLTQNNAIRTTSIIHLNQSAYFTYHHHFGIVMEYCDGRSLPSYKITKRHFGEILYTYKCFQKLRWHNSQDILPAYRIPEKINNLIQIVQKSARTPNTFIFRFFNGAFLHKTLLNFLSQMKADKLDFATSSVLHGDFHNNNLLFHNNQLSAVLDFEEIRYGYPTQDLIRYIICLVQRLPVFINPFSVFKEWLILADTSFHFSTDEWIYGLDTYYVIRTEKLFRKLNKKNKFNRLLKLWQLYFSILQYRRFKEIIRELPA